MHKLVYSITEVMETLRLSRQTVYNEINSGRLRTFNVGRRRMVSAEALRDWVQAREAEATAAA